MALENISHELQAAQARMPIDDLEASIVHLIATARIFEGVGCPVSISEELTAASGYATRALAALRLAQTEIAAYSAELAGTEASEAGEMPPADSITEKDAPLAAETAGTSTPNEPLLQPETTLTRQEILDELDCWLDGESVESRSHALATIDVSAADLAVIRSIDGDFRSVSLDDQETHYGQPQLTAEQRAVVQRLYEAFVRIVRADARRGGLGAMDEGVLIYAGYYDPALDGISWHSDGTTGALHTVRYVVTFGDTSSTMFAHGMLTQHDQKVHDILRGTATAEPGHEWHIETPPQCTVSRFMARYTMHAAPTSAGTRLFMSADVPIDSWG